MKLIEKLKSITAGVIIGSFIAGGVTFAAGEYALSLFQAKIVINGEEKQGSDKEYQYYNGQQYVPTSLIYNGTTYIPLRFFSESLGQPVKYDSATKTIYVGKIPESDSTAKYMSDILEPYYSDVSYEINDSMTVGGKEYRKGYSFYSFMKEEGELSFNLEGKYANISGVIGLADYANLNDSTVTFYGDDELLGTFELEAGSLPKNINLDITGIIKLDVKCYSKTTFSDYPVIHLVNVMIK